MAKRNGSVGSFRTAHGAAAKGGKTVVFEAVADGLRAAEPCLAAPLERDAAGRFTPAGAAVAARRLHELAKVPNFAERELEFIPAAAFAPFDKARRDLLSVRISELVTQYGHCSPGTVTVLRGWAWMIAFAEYHATRAAQLDSSDAAELAAKFFKNASIELAKAHEFARVEVAAFGDNEQRDLRRRQAAFQAELAARQLGQPTPGTDELSEDETDGNTSKEQTHA